jgi:curved DNA-binding protein CbpA
MPLTPADGFVLSRVDGQSSEAEISLATGLDASAVEGALDKLEFLGLVSFAVPPAPSAPNVAAAPRAAANDAEVEVEPELREKILAAHAMLGRADHYALLGVPRSADKKAIKRAYFEMATIYHPDRFFRKNVGTFKPMMEAIFAAMTQAQDVLGSKAGRAEYDAYLGDRAQAEEIEERVNASPPPPPPVLPSGPPRSSIPVSVVPASMIPASAPDAKARRDALARKLLGGRPSGAPPAARMSSPPTSRDPDALRRHFETRLGDTRDKPARQHALEAEEALTKGDAAAAITAYKLAMSFSPGDPTVLATLADIKKRAESVLAESYRRQALYEEKSDNWISAAKSWARLAKAEVNDAGAHDRAAKAMVKANGNLHEAGNLAQRAIILEPKNAEYRVTLANVYIAAGLLRNAKREIEAAQQLSPQDATIAALMKRVSTAG